MYKRQGRGFLTDKQLSNALRAETPQGLGIEWIIGMEEQYKAFDKNSDSVFDYLEFQQIAAHFTIEQTKTMAGASQLLLTDGRRDFMKETNKRKLRKMFDRFDLDGSGGLDKKEIISILNELTESRGKPLDKTTSQQLPRSVLQTAPPQAVHPTTTRMATTTSPAAATPALTNLT